MGEHGLRRAVFLDRDGVLLDHGGLIIPGVKAQLTRLRNDGFFLAVATNQPDIAKGKLKPIAVKRVNDALKTVLNIDAVAMCPHDDMQFCKCRKPKPGMLLELAAEHDVDLTASYMIGDRWRDVSAGEAARVKTILIGTGMGETFPKRADIHVAELSQAVDIILGIN